MACYAAGLLLLLLALISPLDYLADYVSFAAHMLQHLLLLLVIPPLLLLGFPEGFLASLGAGLQRVPGVSWVARPLPALVLAIGIVWIWHVPALYEAALGNETIHAAEHLCFLGTAFLYWWPLARPETHPWPLPDLVQLGYLLAALVASSLLGAVLTFAPDVLYPTYANGVPMLGLSALDDQQAGGLLMWVGGGLWYLAAAGVVFVRWFARPVADEPRMGSDRAPTRWPRTIHVPGDDGGVC